MKEGWEYKKLGEVATYINGFPFKPSDWKEIGKPIIRIQNLTNPHGGFNRCSRNDIPEKYFVVKGDVLISWSATLGVFEWESEDALLNQHIFKVVFDKADIDKHFFKYAVLMSITEMAKHTNGATMKHIRKGDFDNIKIPYPSLSEQKSIVDYFDSAFAKIDAMKANAEKALNEAKALFQASLKEMLEPKEGWEEKKLGEIAFFSQGIQVDVNLQTERCSPGKVRFLRIIDVTQGNVPPRYIDDPGERYYLKADEIAMVRYGTVGFVCYGFEGVIANNLFKVSIKDKSKLQSNYLQYYLKSDLFQSHIRNGVGGAALPAIKFGDIKHIMLGYPSLSEQQSIVETLDSLKSKVDRLKANYDKISQECDALKQAILRQVFE